MIGLLILFILIFYIFIAVKLSQFVVKLAGFSDSPGKVLALVLLLLMLPFADEIIGRIQFQHECKKIEGYTLTDAIKVSRLAKDDDDMSTNEVIPAAIPIRKHTGFIIDVDSRAVLLTSATLLTGGGWLMRAGLNMNTSSACNDVNRAKIMLEHGFTILKDGFFEKTQGSN